MPHAKKKKTVKVQKLGKTIFYWNFEIVARVNNSANRVLRVSSKYFEKNLMEVNAGKCNLLTMASQEVSLKVNYWNIKDSDSKQR